MLSQVVVSMSAKVELPVKEVFSVPAGSVAKMVSTALHLYQLFVFVSVPAPAITNRPIMQPVRPIPECLKAKAASELNEKEKTIAEELEMIRTWIRQSGHIRGRLDDQFLLGFLRACKHSLERVKEKLDTYYTIRSVLPEVMKKRDPLDPFLRKVIKMG